ncbi:MAG TPA: rhomboid family intramembrane serine protease [Cerasibacillus sp.]|uniref:rhomboid family intramembrane serine protease n=1 Tax=Cerasibacillus sp. TaxID=2498711 RepID=UPI002F41DB2F
MFIRTERSVKEFIQFYPVVSLLIIIHLLLWVIIDFLQLPIGQDIYMWGVAINGFIHAGEYWRLFTAMFLHADLMHTLFNSFSLVLFGPALEQMLGKVRFIIAYLFAGFVGNIATYAFDPMAIDFAHLGASGAIYGLFGMYIYMVLFRKDLIDMQSAQMVTVIFLIGLIMTFLRPGINVKAHIFGFIGGIAVAPLVLKGALPFSPWRNKKARIFTAHDDHQEIKFDPNRWNKKRIVPGKVKKNLPWIFLGILLLFGLFNWLGIL